MSTRPTAPTHASPPAPAPAPVRSARRPVRLGYAATAWSALYAGLGLFWTAGGPGFPFGPGHDPVPIESALGSVPAAVAAPALATFGALGAVLGLAATRALAAGRTLGLAAPVFAGYAAVSALALLVVVPDRRVLMLVAYAPILAGVGLCVLVTGSSMPHLGDPGLWTVTNQAVFVLGGLAWAGLAVATMRRHRAACLDCGRAPGRVSRWTTPAAAARWGRWAVGVAVAVPLGYAATRWAWALGLPLGIDAEFYREGKEDGLWMAGAALGSLGILGAVLTLGLVQRWGETYPRWVWFRAGRTVPPKVAVVPATLVSVIVTSAGLEYWRLIRTPVFADQWWATMGPELLWPLWGAGLAAATLAYHLRRRGTCRTCGQG
ncbi:hypothetical protein [Actinopolymorpha singaporensis]|uniref:Uncharacterized protein n=1 Tax=Actinopolymorpha singaporensis TaxID=117157 RepID=A0A1H1LUN5_9ACTN|nr:hypothetical protein [Actinopolymorpha singaporensis]SDR78117.1 hypothetical protein SAMN04489717_0533 [Actinopolymorpha singaporensis]